MTRSAWVITVVLVALALLAVWFFGIDAHHAVVLVGAAFAAGIANGLLESVDLQRPALALLPTPDRGLAEVQALEFSFSATEPGARGVLEVRGIGRRIAENRPGVAFSPELTAFLAGADTRPATHREITAHITELERAVSRRASPTAIGTTDGVLT